jgi:hypothetical protein
MEEYQPSEWKCQLFGTTGDNGITWIPQKGRVPNWFWRTMQYICFGNKWTKRTAGDQE